jgi:flagellar biosynthesis/type III secretory pathway chaperone
MSPARSHSLRAPAAQTPALATLLSSLDRLEETIDQESAAFEMRAPLDIQEINRRKSRSLLELSRAARAVQERPDAALQARLDRLKDKLSHNQHVLSVHLAAAQEVGALLDRALRDAESDGTYSSTFSGEGK